MKFIESEIELFDDKVFVKLTKDDKKKIFCDFNYSHQFVKKDDVIYHIKLRKINYVVNEILGELISEYFGLETVKSQILIDDKPNYYWLLSKNFTNINEKYSYLTEDLFPRLDKNYFIGLDNLNNLNVIYDTEQDKFYNVDKNDLRKLLLNLKKLIVRDFITNQMDRHYKNYLFGYENNHIRLMPIYDYESSFKSEYRTKYFQLFDFNLTNPKVCLYVKGDASFQELLEIALNLNVRELINKMCDEYFLKLSIVEKWDYESVIREKKKDIKRYKLIR